MKQFGKGRTILHMPCAVCARCLVVMPTRLLCPGDSPGKNTGVGCHLLLQGIFPAQELASPPLQRILYHCTTWEALCPMLPECKTKSSKSKKRQTRKKICPQLFSLLGKSYILNATGNKSPLKRSLYLTNTFLVFSVGQALF